MEGIEAIPWKSLEETGSISQSQTPTPQSYWVLHCEMAGGVQQGHASSILQLVQGTLNWSDLDTAAGGGRGRDVKGSCTVSPLQDMKSVTLVRVTTTFSLCGGTTAPLKHSSTCCLALLYDWFFFQFLSTFTPFSTNCPDESHLAQMGSYFAQSTTPSPCSLLSRHTHLSGICSYTKNTPHPTSKHPISWPKLESGQNELPSGQFGPQLGNFFEKWAKRL